MINLVKLPLMIFTPIIIGVFGQVMLKIGMMQIGKYSLLQKGIILQYLKIIFNPYVFFGLTAYFISTLFWLYLISRVPLSFAYPMLSLSYIIITVIAVVLFKEQINLYNWLGIGVIMLGLILVTQGRT